MKFEFNFGAIIGGFIGGLIGRTFWGALLGMIIGEIIAKKIHQNSLKKKAEEFESYRYDYNSQSSSETASQRRIVFCVSAASMFAKMAKIDGVVSQAEIEAVERAFVQLGFTQGIRNIAINAFRRAKSDNYTIYYYANAFANAVPSLEVREIFYGLLWDLACADGRISMEELEILRRITTPLGVRPVWFFKYFRERFGQNQYDDYCRRQHSAGAHSEPQHDELSEAYELLGVSAQADADTLKRSYRELAKKFHPDALRAQGLPEEMLGRANEKMGRINAAWSVIRKARGI